MPRRIDTTFKRLKEEGKAGFIAYICAGDPDIATSFEIVQALEAAGADLVELGIPFSDPLADGIVNQMAAQRALEAGTHTADVLELIKKIRQTSEIPIVLFTYLNPVYAFGFREFHEAAARAGADGVLILDLPPDEARHNPELLNASPGEPGRDGLEEIHLIAPTTPPERIEAIVKQSEGFIYYVSREGVTGARSELSGGIREQVERIKAATSLPVAVGFGISTPSQARTVASLADGVVVGSAIVKIIEKNGAAADLTRKIHDFVKPLVDAVKAV